jgi:hypothetical protein
VSKRAEQVTLPRVFVTSPGAFRCFDFLRATRGQSGLSQIAVQCPLMTQSGGDSGYIPGAKRAETVKRKGGRRPILGGACCCSLAMSLQANLASGKDQLALVSAGREVVGQAVVRVRATTTGTFVFAGAPSPLVNVFLEVRTLLPGLV